MTRRSTEDGLGKFLKTKLSEFIKFCCKIKKWSDLWEKKSLNQGTLNSYILLCLHFFNFCTELNFKD